MTKYIVNTTIQYRTAKDTTITETMQTEHLATGDKIVIDGARRDVMAWAKSMDGTVKEITVYKEVYSEE